MASMSSTGTSASRRHMTRPGWSSRRLPCEAARPFIERMASRPRPCWINLEYLSAESWVEVAMASPRPSRSAASASTSTSSSGFHRQKPAALCASTTSSSSASAGNRMKRDCRLLGQPLGPATPTRRRAAGQPFTYESEALRSLVEGWRQSVTCHPAAAAGALLDDVLIGAGLAEAIPGAGPGICSRRATPPSSCCR